MERGSQSFWDAEGLHFFSRILPASVGVFFLVIFWDFLESFGGFLVLGVALERAPIAKF